MSLTRPSRVWGPFLAGLAVIAVIAAACTTGHVGDRAASTEPAPTSSWTTSPVEPDAVGTRATDDAQDRSAVVQWRPLNEPGVGGRVVDIAIDPADPDHVLLAGDLTGIGVTFDGGETWEPTFGLANPEIGRITFVSGSSDELWAGTTGGPHRSTDGGRTWQVARNGMPAPDDSSYTAPIDKVVIDPNDPTRLIATGGSHREWEAIGESAALGAVWASDDSGATWERRSTVGDGANIVDAVWLDSGVLVVAALGAGVQVSSDGGSTWRAGVGLPHGDVRALVAQPDDPTVVWAALGATWTGSAASKQLLTGGIYRSDDGGSTWLRSSNGLPDRVAPDGSINQTTRFVALAVSHDDPTVLFTADQAWGSEALYRSDDRGESWTQVLRRSSETGIPETVYSTPISGDAVALSGPGGETMWIGNSELVLRTDDRGKTWRDMTSDIDLTGASTGRGFSGLVASEVVFGPPDTDELVLCAFDGANPLVSTDGGTTWRRPLVEWDPWGGCIDVARGSTTWYALLGQGDRFNGIARFQAQANLSVGFSGQIHGLPDRGDMLDGLGSIEVIVDAEGREIILAAMDGAVFRSSDSGTSWTRNAVAPDSKGLAADPATPGLVYLTAGNGVWRSVDAGATFELLADSPGGARRAAVGGAMLYVTIWTSASGGGVWAAPVRAEGTGPWRQLIEAENAHDLAIDPTDPRHLLVATNDHPFRDTITANGVLQSGDGGETWTEINDGLALIRVATVAFDPDVDATGRVVIGTFGRGFFEATMLTAPVLRS